MKWFYDTIYNNGKKLFMLLHFALISTPNNEVCYILRRFLLFCVSVTGTCQNLNGKLTNDSILENRGKKTLVIFKESFLTCCVPWCHHSEITCTFYVHNVTDNRYLQLLIYEMINRVCKLLHSVNNPLKIKEHQT